MSANILHMNFHGFNMYDVSVNVVVEHEMAPVTL